LDDKYGNNESHQSYKKLPPDLNLINWEKNFTEATVYITAQLPVANGQ